MDLSLAAMLQEASRLGAKMALVELGLARENVSYSYACRRYGRKRVDRWLSSGKLQYCQDEFGVTKMEICKADLEALNAGEKMVHHIKIG
jgi:hypothetical protein